ncbi:transposase [Aetokthonos hydrillicola Thurmond2011]|uniref:Transposase n=1 Tax=Aetokthonos hydrillicola Thurmond2011 TaxID=2712845 RepID=A0AAP5M9E5_9CYAN|nr:transposase [Aetokthonos hydrillicola]MBO3459674.1 transposase [Aetokthonos hydrillicola CCALA 1050]MBW4589038.1 transposase [Aetokthonos hydrillicola CCALA 1050]MDR9900111.1 transposase [Aetokthonos hydrillicola Thurmond2011]
MRKLTESDKQEILKLYRETAETTSTLAERYDVSNSTISRLLKSTLPEDEYEYLVSLKRAARTPEGRAQVSYDKPPVFASQLKSETKSETKKVEVVKPSVAAPVKIQQPKLKEVREQPSPDNDQDSGSSVIRRVRRRSSATGETSPTAGEQLELFEQQAPEIKSIPSPRLEDTYQEANVIAQMLGEELLDESEELEDLDDLDEDDEYLDEEDEDDFDVARPSIVTRPRSGDASVRVLPLSAASLPRTCYLVIDRASELITRPLRDFGDLGQIPNLETQQKTLPIFDNHRVAKRFSTKRDRVIKVPDSKMLHKARYHLQAKGITRLLIDGQVYSLSSAQP